MQYLDANRVSIVYEMPLAEIVYEFFDQLKSSTKGYASFDYELIGYKPSKLVKMDIMLNAEKIDALSFIVHRDYAYERGKVIVEKLKELIPASNSKCPCRQRSDRKSWPAQPLRPCGKTSLQNVTEETSRGNGSFLKNKRRKTPDEAGRLGRSAAGGVYGRS